MDRRDIGFNFDKLRISVASPADIESWSYGEVTKPETINYRTQKPERDGLFDEKIFGPTKDFECYCGKYKKIRYKGVICDKCQVEVTRSSVRRERMGHINLCIPISHIWYVRGVPSVLGMVLDKTVNELEKVIYFASYIITQVNNEIVESNLKQLEDEYQEIKKRKNVDIHVIEQQYKRTKNQLKSLAPKMLLGEEEYHEFSMKYGNVVTVGIGAKAVFKLLQNINLEEEIKKIESTIEKVPVSSQKKVLRRLKILKDLFAAGIKPDHLILTKLPVMPPDLRPMVQLDGGRFAASDLNDLYRRVINRNNRLRKLLLTGAPEVITRNERRMLQEAVDALIDNNSRRGKTPQTTGAGNRKLRSLSDMLKGKQGRFRQNLLGKRVDYSGRSVIVVGPELKLGQCGIPKKIALELYKPFVMSKLIEEGHVHNIKNASRMIEKAPPEVWEILERITIKSHVLLNRAPTLHRLGIQAFQPLLVEGKAIQVHPLVCYAYNADFDGDQMAVHLPLSDPAKAEARGIMASVNNLLKPASAEPVVHPRYDIVYGIFYITKFDETNNKNLKMFAGKNEAILAYQLGHIDVKQKIKVRIKPGQNLETCVGRILFNNEIPREMRFINKTMDSGKLKKLVTDTYEQLGKEKCVELVDNLKNLGFYWAGKSGLTISMDDLHAPKEKPQIIREADKQIITIENQFQNGLITEEELTFKKIDIWSQAKSDIEKKMIAGFDKTSPVYEMIESGSRGSFAQVIQMSGMKGLVVSPTGEIITMPIKHSFKEGLEVYEYFISTHGARKGKSDTSLRTSDAGYLTRRLVDVAQDIIVSEDDCGTKKYITVYTSDNEDVGAEMTQRLLGRVSFAQILDLKTGKVIVKKNSLISKTQAKEIENSGIEEIKVRTPIYCKAKWGICKKCYGMDMATTKEVEFGEAVGITAAQAIGEPGTQLTMKTFHMGGVQGEDITSGLPRVEEVFETRKPKRPALLAPFSGVIQIHEKSESYTIHLTSSEKKTETYTTEGYKTIVKTGQVVSKKQNLAICDDKKPIRATLAGKVKILKDKIIIESEELKFAEFYAPLNAQLTVKDGQKVEVGDFITDDHIDLEISLKYRGVEKTIRYIILEIQKIYAQQGQAINDKHIEIIIKQMFSKVLIESSSSLEFIPGQVLDIKDYDEIIADSKNKNLKLITTPILMGITRVALKTYSFLSAASFQETTHTLMTAAIRGAVDNLSGLKENVIIGRLIPAGTGYRSAK